MSLQIEFAEFVGFGDAVGKAFDLFVVFLGDTSDSVLEFALVRAVVHHSQK